MSITCFVKQIYFSRAFGLRKRRKAVGFYTSEHRAPQTVSVNEHQVTGYTVAGSCRAIQWESM